MWKTNIYQLIFCLCFKHGLLTSNQRIGGGVRNVLMWPVQKNYERRGLYWVACRPQLFQTEMEQNGAILSGIYSIPTNLSLTLSSISGWIEVGKLTTICIELGGHSVKTSHLIFSDAGCWEEEYEPVLCPPIRNALGDALKDERWYSVRPLGTHAMPRSEMAKQIWTNCTTSSLQLYETRGKEAVVFADCKFRVVSVREKVKGGQNFSPTQLIFSLN